MIKLAPYFALAMFATGCYAYQPIAGVPQPGTAVRAELTDAGTLELGRLLGLSTASVEGRLIVSDSTAVRIGVTGTETRANINNIWRGEEVTIPRASIARLGERRLNRFQTTVVAVGSGLGAVAVYLLFNTGGGGTPGAPKPPPTQ